MMLEHGICRKYGNVSMLSVSKMGGKDKCREREKCDKDGCRNLVLYVVF